MDSQLLIEQIVRQTIIFIAQLATTGGVRAPLAHLADRVFLMTGPLLALRKPDGNQVRIFSSRYSDR